MEDNIWERQPREPARWYTIFLQYYLAGGLGRSLRKAYLAFKREEGDDAYQEALLARGVPGTWKNMSIRWEWRKRAEAWEESQTQEAMAIVKQAANELRLATVEAVKTLVLLLKSERLGVQAANSILDRGGLPAKQLLEAVEKVTLTSDDMNEATEEAKSWEQETFSESG